ncbi:hypothetical protein [Bradyrhizobium cenepequi]
MTRAIILAATAAAIIVGYLDRPKPVKAVSVPYCVIDIPFAAKDFRGNLHKGWGKGYGPCSQLDRFEDI